MRRIRLILMGNIVVACWTVSADAQASTSAPAAPSAQPSMEQTVKDFDRLTANADQLHRSTMPSRGQKSIAPVLAAIPQFRKATADLRDAVGSKKSMHGPLQRIEKLIKPLAEYFKDLKLKPSPFDVQDLKTYTPKDLLWETLTTAERVDNNLQIANKLLRESSRTDAVSIKAMQFYGEIDSDLKRLKWLADRVEDQR